MHASHQGVYIYVKETDNLTTTNSLKICNVTTKGGIYLSII